MGRKKTDEEFKKEYYNKFPDTNVKILGKYEASETPIECTCKICNYKWKTHPHGLMNKSGCPRCAGTLKYTTESFKEAYYNKFPDSNVIIAGEYINTKTKIRCLCKVCDWEWHTKPSLLMSNHGCPKCVGNIKYNTASFKGAYYEKYPDSNVIIAGEYVNTKTKIRCLCKACDWEWFTNPSALMSNHGCPKCAGTLKYNTESFKEAYYRRFPNSNVIIAGEYVNTRTKIRCLCKVCDWEWFTTPHSLMSNRGCPKCGGNAEYTTESYKKVYYQNNPDSKIDIIGEFVNSITQINCKCRICDWEWSAYPTAIRNDLKCPYCSGKMKYDTKSFKKKFYERFPDSTIFFTSDYINSNSNINCECSVCGYKWAPNASNILAGNGANCPYCSGTIKNYTTELFIKKLNERYPYNNIIVKGEYINAKTRITAECAICHKQWNPFAGDLMTGNGCPYCNINKTEKSLGAFLDSLGISYTPQKKFPDCKDKKELSFDYEIDDERFATFLLEYQGEQHERPVDFAGKGPEWTEKQLISVKSHDKIKYDYCKMTERPLEYIWYYEEDKIQALINLLRKYIKPEYDLDEILANAKMNKTA